MYTFTTSPFFFYRRMRRENIFRLFFRFSSTFRFHFIENKLTVGFVFMDLSSLPPYDPWCQFDGIPVDLASDQNQNLMDCAGLLMAWGEVTAVQNGSANRVSNMQTTAIRGRCQSTPFDPAYIDCTAEQMLSSMNLTCDDIDFDNFPAETSEHNEIHDDSEFPWATNDVARSPVDGIVRQSNSYAASEIHFQPIPQQAIMPSLASNFGSTQLAPYMPVVPLVVTSTYELKSIKKSSKKKSSASTSTHLAAPDLPRMAEWYLKDENGRRRRPLLHEYIRLLLANKNYSEIAEYVDKSRGIFKFYQREKAAQLWGFVKGRNGSSS